MVTNATLSTSCRTFLLMFLATLLAIAGTQRTAAQISIVTPYPIAAGNLTRGGFDTSLLGVQVSFGSACSNIQVTISLPPGVGYVPGSVVKTGGTAGVTIAQSGGTSGAPVFAISGVTGPGDLSFTVRRTAGCGSTGAGKDGISITSSCGSASETNVNVNSYTIFAPSLSLTAPASNINANVGATYLRTVSVTNGGNGCLDTFSYFMVLPAGRLGFVDSVNFPLSVQLSGGSLAATDFLPVRIAGDTLHYRISGAAAFGPDLKLCNGEVVNIRENLFVKTCGSGTVYYAADWGRNSAACQQAIGNSVITSTNNSAGFTNRVAIAPALGGCLAPSYTITDSLINSGSVGVNYTRFTIANSVAASNVFIDTASIMVGYPGTPAFHPATGITVTALNTNTTPCVSGKPQNVSYTFPSRFVLPAGASLAVTYSVITGCRDSSSCAASYTAGTYTVTHGYTLLCDNTALTRGSVGQTVGYSVRMNAFTIQTPAQVRHKEEFSVKVPVVFSIPASPLTTVARRSGLVTLTLPAGLTLLGATEAIDTGTNIAVSTVGNVVSYRFVPNIVSRSHYVIFRLRNDAACGYQPLVARASIVLDSTCSPETRLTASQCFTNITKYKCPPAGGGGTGCPGANGPEFSFRRSSYGAPDNNQDGLPDASGALDFTRVDPDRYMIGDTLRSVTSATITARGVAPLDTFSYVYGEWNFPVGTWTPAGPATITIRRGSTTYTCSNVPITTLTASRIFRADWKSNPCVAGFGQYRGGDSVVITAAFRLSDPTTVSGSEVAAKNGSTYDHTKDAVSRLVHLIYASNNPAPPTGGSIGIGTNPGYACDTALYNAWLTGWRHVVSSSSATATGCSNVTKTFTSTTTVSNANNGSQYFTAEYRPIAVPDTFIVTLPAGWEYVAPMTSTMAYTTRRGSSTTASFTITPLVTTNTQGLPQLLFDFAAAFRNGVIPPAGTEGVVYTVNYSVRPASCATPAAAKDSVSEIGRLVDPFGVTTSRYTIFSAPGSTMNYGARPVLSITNNSGIVTAATQTSFWDIQINNTAVTAANVWLALDQTPGTVTVDSVALLNSGGTATTGLLPRLSYGTGKTWYQAAASLGSSGNQKLRVYFRYANCAIDSVRAFAGYDCAGYPSSPASPACAGLVSADVFLKVLSRPSEIQLSVARQPGAGGPISLCSTDSAVFIVNSAQPANILNPRVQIILPPGMSAVTPIPVEYPLGSNNWQNITATDIQGGYEINLSNHTGIGGAGLKGTAVNPAAAGRQAKVKVAFNTGCAYRSGSTIAMYGYADRTCGATAIGDGTNVKSKPLEITGIPAGGGTISMAMSLPTTTISCSGTATLSLVSIPLGSPTQGEDSVIYTLPSGIEYGGAFTPDSNCTGCVVTTGPGLLPGSTDVKVKLPASLPANTRIKYAFNVTGSGAGCGSSTIEATAVRTYPGVFCGATQCSNSTKVVGNSVSGTILRDKPQLGVSGMSLLDGAYLPGQRVTYKLDYQNVGGSTAAANTYRAEFFRSANDTPFASRMLAKSLTASTSASDTVSLIIPATASRGETISVKLQTRTFSGISQCVCNASAFRYAVPLPVTLLDFSAKLLGNTARIGWQVASDKGISSYVIERSTDGERFVALGVVSPYGGDAAASYQYIDEQLPEVPAVFYRLRMMSDGGSTAFSKTERIALHRQSGELRIIPNPAAGAARMQLSGTGGGDARIQVIDATGRTVRSYTEAIPSGSSETGIPGIGELPGGAYQVRVSIGAQVLVARLIISR